MPDPRVFFCDARDDVRAALVAKLAAQRYALAKRIVRDGVLAEERTIAADIVAGDFVDHLLTAMERRSYVGILQWVDRTRQRFRDVVPVHSMLASGVRGVSGTLRAWEVPAAELAAELESLADAIDATLLHWYLVPLDAALDEEIDADVDRLLGTLASCDCYTRDHSQAVAEASARVARLLSFSGAGVNFVARSGALHDIGKTTVGLDVLNAPRALAPHEWVAMREHAAAGAAIVGAIESLRPFAPIVRAHHERFDGRGYPDGLMGSGIPFAARIVAAVDAFGAMIDERPYSPAMSVDDAIDELVRHSGTQFDPIVVEALIESLRMTAFRSPSGAL